MPRELPLIKKMLEVSKLAAGKAFNPMDKQMEYSSRLSKISPANSMFHPNDAQANNSHQVVEPIPMEQVRAFVQNKLNSYSYFVERTVTGKSLPVYTKFRGGRKYTVIRRIYGNINELSKDIKASLSEVIQPEHVRVAAHKRHIIIRGLKDLELKYWLANKGF